MATDVDNHCFIVLYSKMVIARAPKSNGHSSLGRQSPTVIARVHKTIARKYSKMVIPRGPKSKGHIGHSSGVQVQRLMLMIMFDDDI